MQKVRVGVVGCGKISDAYLSMARNLSVLEVAACADLVTEVAEAKARDFGIPLACTVDEMMADPTIEVVLNLTVPKAHVEIALRALEAGKHTYAEKPLGIDRAEAKRVLDLAERSSLRVGCAPDTVLGSGAQTARKLIDDDAIGRPVAFTAFMMGHGPEDWHPSPEFYYQPGGGPMFDMGPYYLTALLNLLGPVKRLTGLATTAIPERTITSQPRNGKKITVETPDHVCGMLEFENGCAGSIITSFATWNAVHDGKQPITIYGTEGVIRVPDPNAFDGPVSFIRNVKDAKWEDVPPAFPTGYGRSLGLADMATAIRTGRPHRATGDQGFAVLDLMQGFLESSTSGRAVMPSTQYRRPAPMPTSLPFGTLD